MRMLEKPKGIIINFHCTNVFKDGQKTLVNEYYAALPQNLIAYVFLCVYDPMW